MAFSNRRANPRQPNYGRANFGQISPYRDRAEDEEELAQGDFSPTPSAASQSTSALDAALRPKMFQRVAGRVKAGAQELMRPPVTPDGQMGAAAPAPRHTSGPVDRALMGGGYTPGQLSGGRSVDYAGLQRDYGWDQPTVDQKYGALGALGTPASFGNSGVMGPQGGAPQGQASFDGKNWQGVTSTADGGDFSRLSGFDATKFGDTGNATGDALTSKYVFGRVASKYDPKDPDALPKIVAELNAQGIPAKYDGKDAIDFGDGYGWIDVQQKWVQGQGGGPWDWMPKGGAGGGGGVTPGGNPLMSALMPNAATGGMNIQSLLASGAVDPNDPLWAQILRNLQAGTGGA